MLVPILYWLWACALSIVINTLSSSACMERQPVVIFSRSSSITQLAAKNCRKRGGQGGKKRKPLRFSHSCPLIAADKRKTTGFSYRSVLQGGQAAVSRCLWPKAWHLSICSNKRAKDKGLHPLQTTQHMDMHSHAKNLHWLNSFPGSQ